MALTAFDIFAQGVQMFLVPAFAPLLCGVIRKVKSRLQRRQGASVFQPYRDLWKLLRKDVVPAENTSWIYRAAPYFILAATWVAITLVPTFATALMFHWAADLIAIVGLLATARFALALAGMDVGTSFGGLGASREMMFSTIAEPAMLMVVFTVSMIAHTTQLSAIADFLMMEETMALRISLVLTLVTLVTVLIAENGRVPVDNPATHLELTMVHEAMILEYSGRHLALIEAAAMLKLVLYIAMFNCLFVPFGMMSEVRDIQALGVALGIFFLKLLFGGVLLAFGETSVAKMRVFRVNEFLGVGLMLGLLAALLLFASEGMK